MVIPNVFNEIDKIDRRFDAIRNGLKMNETEHIEICVQHWLFQISSSRLMSRRFDAIRGYLKINESEHLSATVGDPSPRLLAGPRPVPLCGHGARRSWFWLARPRSVPLSGTARGAAGLPPPHTSTPALSSIPFSCLPNCCETF